MTERLSFETSEAYSAVEAAIHLCRYSLASRLCAGKRVLDISCGEGYGSHFLAAAWGAAEVHGVDISAEAIQQAQQHFSGPRITFHCRPAEELDQIFEPASFDLVVCLETIEHLHDANQLLACLRRLLKPDGTILLSCPNDHWYYPEPHQGNPYHLRKFTYAEFLQVTSERLGPPAQILLGVPAAGYANVEVGGVLLQTGGGDPTPLAMLRVAHHVHAAMLPADAEVEPKNCSYFVGVWGPGRIENAFVVFPCSMDRNTLAKEQQVIAALRDELAQLRAQVDRLERQRRDAELMAAAWRAETEYVRQVAVDLRGAPPPPTPRSRFAAVARAAAGRLKRLLKR